MSYKGKISPKSFKNPKKYIGDLENIVYRSLWERNTIYWLDINNDIKHYACEEIVIPYFHPIYARPAKYYLDIFIELQNGKKLIVEIKPLKETVKPAGSRKTKRLLNETATFAVNQEKWKAAKEFCVKNNIEFQVWTENTLKHLDIMKDLYSYKKKKTKINRRPSKRPTRKS